MSTPERIMVAVVYAAEDQLFQRELPLPVGATVEMALVISGLLDRFRIEDLPERVGIFGQRCPLDTRLENGDRVEVYRWLRVDPKDARRLRADAQAFRPGGLAPRSRSVERTPGESGDNDGTQEPPPGR